jgi:hypothetical protein
MSIDDELRAIGVTPELVGMPIANSRDGHSDLLPFAWVLHANREGFKRVRAIAVTAVQFAEVNSQRKADLHSNEYIWSGFDLKLSEMQILEAKDVTHVYAVVDAADANSGLSIASEVRVCEAHTTLTAAEIGRRALEAEYPNFFWAVVKYPVGKMLF